MKSIVLELNDIDLAKKEAAIKLNVSERLVDVKVLSEKGGLFRQKTYTVEATINVNIADYGLSILNEMFELMNIKANVEMKVRNTNQVSYTVNTNENPLLIGKNGKTLEAIQTIIRTCLFNLSEERLIVSVDIGGYKDNRKRQLEIVATKTAKEVVKTRIEAKLEPMNSYERRIIHTKLSEWRDVSTQSDGQGKDRHVVIKPKRR